MNGSSFKQHLIVNWTIIHMAVYQQKDSESSLLELGFGLMDKNVCMVNTEDL